MNKEKLPSYSDIELLDQRIQQQWEHNYKCLEDLSKRVANVEKLIKKQEPDLIPSIGILNQDIKVLKDHIIESNKKIDKYYTELNCVVLRVLKLEKYFDDDKFHHVLDELKDLEKEYSKKAAELVMKIVNKPIKKRKS